MDSKKNGELSKKMNFESMTDKRDEFYKESDEYAGKEVELTFKLDYEGELNGKEFSDTFKEGQDFEYVKYKLSHIFSVSQDQIDWYRGNTMIIPIYSICDIPLEKDEIITVKLKPE